MAGNRRPTYYVVAVIFIVAFVARFILGYTPVFEYALGATNSPDVTKIGVYDDFYGIYLIWINLLGRGLIPYVNGAFPLLHYPPLFLYSLYLGYLAGGVIGAGMIITVSDCASAVMIYLIAKELSSDANVAKLTGLAYALLPLALLTEGISLLSLEPMTFFILLSIYFLHKNRLLYSAILLAVAVCFRQEALFLLIVYLPMLYEKPSSMLLPAAAFLLIVALVSAPFLAINAQQYISEVLYSHNPTYPTSGQLYISSTVLLSPLYILCPAVLIALAMLLNAKRLAERKYEYLGAVGVVVLVMLYGMMGYEILNYYMLPAYALLLASCTKSHSIAAVFIVSTISIFAAPGWQQEIMPLVALLALAMITERARNK